jgi:hypothetical protein
METNFLATQGDACAPPIVFSDCTGHFRGRLVFLSWQDGKLVGDPEAVKMIKRLAAEVEGHRVWTPTHIGGIHDHLSNPYKVYQLMKMVLKENHPEMSGSLPQRPPPPPGATY